jgi:hypothetical protein
MGSGGDVKQRVLSPHQFATGATGGGGFYGKATHEGLFAYLKYDEAEGLVRADVAMSRRLVPGRLPANGDMLAQFQHHLQSLTNIAARVTAAPNVNARTHVLLDEYRQASTDFAAIVGRRLLPASYPSRWIECLSNPLLAFAEQEGF